MNPVLLREPEAFWRYLGGGLALQSGRSGVREFKAELHQSRPGFST